jgi:RNA recognition motif-containing protein
MSESNDCKLFVGNVPFECIQNEFEDCFKHLAGFKNAEIINRYNSPLSRGFGFVTFDNIENAQIAMAQKNIVFKDRILRLSEYNFEDKKKVINDVQKKILFIKNVPLEMSRDELYSFFSKYGEIERCFTNTNIKTGQPKGTAVIEFRDENITDLLLLEHFVVHDNGTQFEILKWNNGSGKIQKKKPDSSVDIYRVAFNAGRTVGFQEGLLTIKSKKKKNGYKQNININQN